MVEYINGNKAIKLLKITDNEFVYQYIKEKGLQPYDHNHMPISLPNIKKTLDQLRGKAYELDKKWKARHKELKKIQKKYDEWYPEMKDKYGGGEKRIERDPEIKIIEREIQANNNWEQEEIRELLGSLYIEDDLKLFIKDTKTKIKETKERSPIKAHQIKFTLTKTGEFQIYVDGERKKFKPGMLPSNSFSLLCLFINNNRYVSKKNIEKQNSEDNIKSPPKHRISKLRYQLKKTFNISDDPIKHDTPKNMEKKETGLYYVAQFQVQSYLTTSTQDEIFDAKEFFPSGVKTEYQDPHQ